MPQPAQQVCADVRHDGRNAEVPSDSPVLAIKQVCGSMRELDNCH